MALRLKRLGIQRVFPLLGGVDAWVEAGYPVDSLIVEVAGTPAS